MRWRCPICGDEQDAAPTCFGIDAPWRALVPEEEFAQRVELKKDQCVVDAKTFFIRGHIEAPVHDAPAKIAGLYDALQVSLRL
jgi:hypothetical protein